MEDSTVEMSSNQLSDNQLSEKPVTGQLRSQARATVYLVNLSVRNSAVELETMCPGITADLKHGDVVEFLKDSGYRSQGIKMVFKANDSSPTYLVNQDVDCDDYGSPSVYFIVLKDFPPRYWDQTAETGMRVSDKYALGQKSKFYWHSDRLPVTLAQGLIITAIHRQIYSAKFFDDTTSHSYVVVEYAGEKYGVIVDEDTIASAKSGKCLTFPLGHSVAPVWIVDGHQVERNGPTDLATITVPATNWIALVGIFDTD